MDEEILEFQHLIISFLSVAFIKKISQKVITLLHNNQNMSDKSDNIIQGISDITFQVLGLQNSKELGTCFLIDNNKLLTAAHVVYNEETQTNHKSVLIGHENWEKNITAHAKRINFDKDLDLALLKIKSDHELGKGVNIPQISQKENKIGDKVSWLGYPIFPGEKEIKRLRLGSGTICSNIFHEKGAYRFEINGEMNSGHSGGPIFDNEKGKIIGIVQSSVGSMKGLYGMVNDLNKILSQASQPLVYQINHPEDVKMKQGNVPFGWISINTNMPGGDDAKKKILDSIELLNLPVKVEKLDDGDFFIFPPSLSSLISISSNFLVTKNLVDGLNSSYQMGVGKTVTSKVILEYIDRFK